MAICPDLQVPDLGFVIAESPFGEFGTSHLEVAENPTTKLTVRIRQLRRALKDPAPRPPDL